MSLGLQWGRLRLDLKARSTLDRAVTELNRTVGGKFRLIKHPSGKVIACRLDDFWFCRVGEESDPPRIWPVVVDTRPEQRTLLPTESAADFDECCDLLGFRTPEQQSQFRDFLRLDTDRATTSSVPGAS